MMYSRSTSRSGEFDVPKNYSGIRFQPGDEHEGANEPSMEQTGDAYSLPVVETLARGELFEREPALPPHIDTGGYPASSAPIHGGLLSSLFKDDGITLDDILLTELLFLLIREGCDEELIIALALLLAV